MCLVTVERFARDVWKVERSLPVSGACVPRLKARLVGLYEQAGRKTYVLSNQHRGRRP